MPDMIEHLMNDGAKHLNVFQRETAHKVAEAFGGRFILIYGDDEGNSRMVVVGLKAGKLAHILGDSLSTVLKLINTYGTEYSP